MTVEIITTDLAVSVQRMINSGQLHVVRVPKSARIHVARFKPGELVGLTLCKKRMVGVPAAELGMEFVTCKACERQLSLLPEEEHFGC